MKKKLAFMISVLLVCTCVLGLTACSSGGNGEHKHEYENEWSFDKNEHWQICKTCGGKGNVGKHSFIDGACKCGYAKGSENLSYKISVDDNYYIVTGIGTCKEKNISILSTYNGKPVREIEEKAFEGNTSIESVFIPNGVRKIGEKAFEGCSYLASVTIPDSVTDIEKNAFSNCALTNIVIPNNITRIKEGVFSGCSSLSSVTIPSSVNTIEMDAFSNCQRVKDVFYVGSVENWCKIKCETFTSNPLSNGAKLYINGELVTNLDISDGVTSIGDSAFSGCSSLTSVTIPDSVTSIGSIAFEGCPIEKATISALNIHCIPQSKLKEVVITSGDRIEGYAFDGCSSLTSITIPSSVTSIGDSALKGCSSLTSITIPSSVTSIGGYAFSGCSSLTSITIPSSVSSIGYETFSGCSSLTSITIPSSVTSIESSAFEGCSSLTSITIPNSVTSIESSAFEGCPIEKATISALNIHCIPQSKLKEVVITSGDSIEGHAFYGCSSLTSVIIPNSVTSIGNYAFRRCSALEKIEVEKGNTKYHSDGNCIIETVSKTLVVGCNNSVIPTDGSVTSIGKDAFYGCSSLTSVMIPDSVTSIRDSAFYGCSSLTSVMIPDSVTNIGIFAFEGCSSLKKIEVEKGNTKYHSDGNCIIETASKMLILGCKNSLIPADGSVTRIGEYAFKGCSSLTSITIPSSVSSIEYETFSGCSSLTSVIIGSGVTSIESSAFKGCSSLTSITIPNSVTSIGSSAFEDCNALSEVFYKGTSSEWNRIVINDYNSNLSNAIRYYYSETEPTYSGNYWHYVDGVVTKW